MYPSTGPSVAEKLRGFLRNSDAGSDERHNEQTLPKVFQKCLNARALLLLITNLLASLSGCPLSLIFAGEPSFAIGACNRAALLPSQSSFFFLCGHLAALCSSLSQIQHLTLFRFGSGSLDAASCAVRFACHHACTIIKHRAGPEIQREREYLSLRAFPFSV